jgi:hypothetical protein
MCTMALVDVRRNSEKGVQFMLHVLYMVCSINMATSKHCYAYKCDLPMSIKLPAFQAYCELHAGCHSLGYSAGTSLNYPSLDLPGSCHSAPKIDA